MEHMGDNDMIHNPNHCIKSKILGKYTEGTEDKRKGKGESEYVWLEWKVIHPLKTVKYEWSSTIQKMFLAQIKIYPGNCDAQKTQEFQ